MLQYNLKQVGMLRTIIVLLTSYFLMSNCNYSSIHERMSCLVQERSALHEKEEGAARFLNAGPLDQMMQLNFP